MFLVLMSLGQPDKEPEEDDIEGTGPGGVGDADDLPEGTPNVPDASGKK